MLKTSIVIPSYGTFHLLDKCLRGIYENTDVNNLQIIVVCNGADEDSARLVIQNGLQLVWYREAIGFTKATNAGIKLVDNPVTLLMNTDAHIMNYWERNRWIETLVNPLENSKIGISGMTRMGTEWGEFVPFFCTAIRTELFNELGLLDERFSPGYGEDLDFCIRARQKGYEIVNFDRGYDDDENQMVVTEFPIYHRGQQSFSNELREKCLENSRNIMKLKWG